MTGHSVEVTHKLAKQADGTYTSGDYTVRKQVAADCYDPYSDIPDAVREQCFWMYPRPKPRGWIVEGNAAVEDFDDQWTATLTGARELIQQHRFGFWWKRCESFASVIDNLAGDDAEIKRVVLDEVRNFGLTMADFIELDERPGQFHISGRGYERGHWHRNLRVTRNDPSNDLFERLKANSTA